MIREYWSCDIKISYLRDRTDWRASFYDKKKGFDVSQSLKTYQQTKQSKMNQQ
jgi:hypothetical protein